MSRASESRRQRRTLSKAGIAKMDRVVIDSGAFAAAVTNGANLVDLIAYHVAEALGRLDADGADIVGGKTVISIGEHPDFPGGVTIEAKAATLKRGAVEHPGDCDDPRCPLDHSLDQLDDEEDGDGPGLLFGGTTPLDR